jgi:hypothetical protein
MRAFHDTCTPSNAASPLSSYTGTGTHCEIKKLEANCMVAAQQTRIALILVSTTNVTFMLGDTQLLIWAYAEMNLPSAFDALNLHTCIMLRKLP